MVIRFNTMYEAKTRALTSSSGRAYVGLSVSKKIIAPYLTALRKELKKRSFELVIGNRTKRDGVGYHLTVLSPDECEKINQKSISDYKNRAVQITLFGIGKVESVDGVSYFIVVKSDDARKIRKEAGEGHRDFHITLGFLESDVHGVTKDRTTEFLRV